MNSPSIAVPASAPRSASGRAAAVFTLILLSPVISEVISGSTRLTTLFVLIPATGVWGCAALLLREFARRRGASLWLLGVALAIAEECVIQQTSLAPLAGQTAATTYGRYGGLNAEYFLWALGFECVWAVVIPVALTEVIFPGISEEPWLGRRGIAIASVVLAISSLAAWYSWTHVFLPKFYPQSVYAVPAGHTLIAAAIIAALLFVASRRHPNAQARAASRLPSPVVAGLLAAAWALPWFLQILIAFGAARSVPPPFALLGGAVLGGTAVVVMRRWVRHPGFGDAHRLALIVGVVAATMVGGFFSLAAAHAQPIDRIAHIGFSLALLAWLAVLGRRVPRPAASR